MRYYVYILLDDTKKGNYDNEYSSVKYKPFYVGKGDSLAKSKSKRHLIHYKEVEKNLNESKNPHKFNKIKKLQKLGFKPNFLIVYKDNDEKKVLDVESKLIKYYGKSKDGGILTNISDGGIGGNLFIHIDGLREKIDKISSERWRGAGNPNYNKKIEDTYSHKFILENGYHWNSGRKMSDNLKEILKQHRHNNLPFVEMICPLTNNIIDKLKTLDAIKKYNLNPSALYRALNYGGKHNNYYWKYENKDLVLSKSKKDDYVKPKTLKKEKKIFFKEKYDDLNEICFESASEASEKTGINKEVIRRKCLLNNTDANIFRYENDTYKFNIKKGRKVKIMSIDNNGVKNIYESATDAAKKINGNLSAIIAVCKGNRNKHRNLIFKYV
jgi:hypothetical protein